MLAKMVSQFLFNVEWGEIDILLLDLPPGTGAVQITLPQSAPLTASVIVTTPSAIALEDVRRGVEMFRQSEVPLLGLIENMSHFACPKFTGTSSIFGTGGGEQTARAFELPLLGQVPLDIKMRQNSDAGTPLVQANPDAPAAQALEQIATRIAQQLEASET